MTRKERKAETKTALAKAEWFKLRHAELVKSGMSQMDAHNQAHRELVAAPSADIWRIVARELKI
ncbi:MAG TPA: hypothetical protein VIY48_20690 [Candidatus Paceibacterota bacterium]